MLGYELGLLIKSSVIISEFLFDRLWTSSGDIRAENTNLKLAMFIPD